MADQIQVREFNETDIEQLLNLMRGLAAFEHYLDAFAVSRDDLIERGLNGSPQFTALVAVNHNDELLGMAVYYLVPYTYDLAPDMVLKELFVSEDARSQGVGEALMERLQQDAKSRGCERIKWFVLSDNERAKSFYKRIGGKKDTKWENWTLTLPVQSSSSDEKLLSIDVN